MFNNLEEQLMKMMRVIKQFCLILVFSLLFVSTAPLYSTTRAMEIMIESDQSAEQADSEPMIDSSETNQNNYVPTDTEAFTEIPEKRTASTKVYLLESKRYEAVQFGLPVHYLENGEYKPIDNTLQLTTNKAGESCYANRANSFTTELSTSLTGSQVATVTKSGYSLSWSIDGLGKNIAATAKTDLSAAAWSRMAPGEQRRSAPGLSSQIQYANVLPDTDLEIQVISDRVKENIVLQKYTGIQRVSQTLTVDGLTLQLQADNSILAVNSSDEKETIFWLPRPYAIDQAGDLSQNIKVSLEDVTKAESTDSKTRTYKLTYELDTVWLEKAAYPVRIDPTVYTSFESSDILDTYVTENSPNSNYYGLEFISTGNGETSGTNYTLVKFTDLPSIGPASMIQYAGLRLAKLSTSTYTSYVSAHEITDSWSSSTVTWTNKPSYNSQVEDYQQIGLASGVDYFWDITRVAKQWYTGGSNYGILLQDMASANNYKQFYSADAIYYPEKVPVVYFVYTNFSGLEGYWDYASVGLGNGAANANLYNGNLVYTQTDLSTNGNRMPVSITHTFNSTNKDVQDVNMLYGRGWRTNYDQRVVPIDFDNNNVIDYYQYVDEDGTIHYFSKDDGIWKDESGLDLTLTVAADNVVTITDKKENKLVFYATNSPTRPGFLNYIQDRNDNCQIVGYEAGADGKYRISQVRDGAGHIVLLERFANGYLSKIRQKIDETNYRDTTFTYSGYYLSQITYPDGKSANFYYDANGNIDYARKYVDSTYYHQLDLAYTTSAPYRLIFMGESATDDGVTTYGGHNHLTYAYNRTTVEDSEGRQAQYQFNDYGNTVCVVGPDGGATYAGYGTTETSGSMSKVTTASKFQKFGQNYLQNHNAEYSTDWLLYSGPDSTGTHTFASDQKYLGEKSIKLTRSASDYTYEVARQDLTLVKGETYTLSGYIKTSSVSESDRGAYLMAIYYDASGTGHSVSSSYLTGTNDWSRSSLTFTVPADSSTTTVRIYCFLNISSGTAWYDCLQVEKGPIANRYNIVENADFRYVTSSMPDDWTAGNCGSSDIILTSADSTNPVTNDDNRFRMYGEPDEIKYIEQSYAQDGVLGDTYVMGFWGKAASVPLTSGTLRSAAAFVFFDYTNPDYTDEWKKVSLSPDSQIWQYACGAVVASHNYQAMKVRLQYKYQANSVQFDAVQLFKEEFGNTYAYDSDGNLTKVTNASKQDEEFQYNTNNDLTKYIDPSGKEFNYTYDANHNVLTATSAEGIVYTYTYDSYGNQLSAKVGGSTSYIRSKASYTPTGNYTDIVTDPFGEQTDYNFDAYKGTLGSVVDPLGKTVSNTYDADSDALTQTTQSSDSKTMTNTYTYLDDRLTKVAHNAPTGTMAYDFEYNDLGWTTGVQITGAAQNLITYTLQAHTGRLNSMAYGNGQTITNTYDSNDQLKKVSQGSTGLYAYEYDNSGNLGYTNDLVQGKEYWYEYDSLNRLGKIRTLDDEGNASWSQYGFNSANKLSSFKENIRGTNYATYFSYDDDSRPINTSFYAYDKAITYDGYGLNRTYLTSIQYNDVDKYKTYIHYDFGDGTTSADSSRVSSIVNGYQGLAPETLSYTYDVRGYITKVYKDANNYSEYRYDGFGQLIRENYKWNGISFTMEYFYDVGGNFDEKIKYEFAAGDTEPSTLIKATNYTYGDTAWKDKMTTYDGVYVTYDEIGNPLTDGEWTYTWTQGRKLATMAKSGTSVSYKYNSDGIRTEKTVDGVKTVYNVVGDKVTWEKTGTANPNYYLYDASGMLWAIQYHNGSSYATYFYVRNAQGDIIKLIDKDGVVKVTYDYDAWGNLLRTDGDFATTLGEANPYRYRGYRYDEETGLYSLSSRYYDPTTGRFINADAVIGTPGDLTGENMFAYCRNNPVMKTDSTGMWCPEGDGHNEVVINGVGYIKTPAPTTTETTVTPQTTVNGTHSYIRSTKTTATGSNVTTLVQETIISFDNTIEGQKAAGDFNLQLQQGATYTENMLIVLIGTIVPATAGAKAAAIFGAIGTGKTILGIDFIKAPCVEAGDTYISIFTASYSDRGGSCGSGGYRIIKGSH